MCPLTGEKLGLRDESKAEVMPSTNGTNGTLVREGAEPPTPAAPAEGKSEAVPAEAPAPADTTAPAAVTATVAIKRLTLSWSIKK